MAALDLAMGQAVKETRSVPSTDGQREIWTAAQLGYGASCAYNQSRLITIEGELKLEGLHSAFQGMIEGRDALRASFSGDGLVMNIAPTLKVQIPVIDLRLYDEESRARRVQEAAAQEMEHPFDLTAGPLVRASLIRTTARETVLLFSTHHIVCDGWSMGLLLEDLADRYTHYLSDEEAPSTGVSRYGDYARQQGSEASLAQCSKALQYWRARFADRVPVLELPTDHQRPPDRNNQAARELVTVEPAVVAALRELGAENGCTFFVTLLAVFEVFLHRTTGQDDIVVGIPVAEQAASKGADLVGHCANLLPVRALIDSEASFRDIMISVRGELLDAHENRHCSFGRIVRDLRVARDAGRVPLASVMFNVAKDVHSLAFGGLKARVRTNPRRFEHFDLSLNVTDTREGAVVEVFFNRSLFDPEGIRRRLEEFTTLLAQVVSSPARPVSRLPIVPPRQRRILLEEWNDTGVPLDPVPSLSTMFAVQADRTPDDEALSCRDKSFTYRELDERANRLANHLVRLGVGPGSLVAISLDRSAQMVVGLLGVLKAGAAYVPLDPDYPEARLRFMLEDSCPAVLLTAAQILPKLSVGDATVVLIDEQWPTIESECAPTIPVQEGQDVGLAYVMYTSGSTGRPKGVQVGHRAVVNFLKSMAREPGFRPDDVMVAVTTLSFDIAVLELLLPLVVGGRLVLVDRQTASDGRLLADTIERENATVMQATPATWRLLIQSGWSGAHKLKALCGGEALSADLASQLVDLTASVWNMYGPTETTIWSTCCRVHDANGPPPIGRPIDNTRLYVLDPHMEPVPIGVAGELYIGGAGVSSGYLKRPELTAARFVLDRFVESGSATLYRTGDLVRYRSDGNLEFLGRIDNQVKVRGFRIELGEVEAALTGRTDVEEAIVAIQEEDLGDQRIVAYVRFCEGKGATQSELRATLRSTLPDYMIPQHFREMEVMPLTPNGKVDRSILPAIDRVEVAPEADSVPPQTTGEHLIARIWLEALGIDGGLVGVHDNFFELGGHSLLAMTVIQQIEARTGHRFTLNEIANLTLAQLAVCCVAANGRGSPHSVFGRILRKLTRGHSS